MKIREYPDIHFVDTDTETLVTALITSYEKFTGRTLYPADPARLFILWVADIIIQERVNIDFSARQNVPRYAEGKYLDSLAELFKDTYRLEPEKAKTTLRYTLSIKLESATVIPAGARATSDGNIVFATLNDLIIPAGQLSGDVAAECTQTGEIGNGFVPGQIKQAVDVFPYFQSVSNTTKSAGGADKESDAAFYERLRKSVETFSTAGPMGGYEYFAKSASALIVDVKATSPEPGEVDVRILLAGGELPEEEILKAVSEILNAEKVRPLTDHVTVSAPEIVPYPNPAINPAKLTGIKPAFAQAAARANITNGDTLAIILGKIAKMYADLKAVAWSGSYADLTNKPSNFTPAAHTHDDRYFTETEITTKLNAKSDTTHTHTAAQVGAAAVSSGTWTPNLNDAYNACFTNTNASGVWYRAGNIALFYFQTQLTRKSSNSANMYCTTPFAGHTFGEVILRGPTSPTLRKNWVLANTNTNSTWMLIPGGVFATESQMSVGTDFWYYGHGTVLL